MEHKKYQKYMAKVKPKNIPIEKRRKIIGDFFGLISNLRTKREIIDLFVGLLTPSESLMLARRLQVAKCIIDGDTFDDIRQKIGVGFGTISKVDRWLHERDEAYKKVIIKRWPKEKGGRKEGGTRYNESLLDRYPQYRFLKDLLSL